MRKAAFLFLVLLGSAMLTECSRSAPTRFYLLRSTLAPDLSQNAAASTAGIVAVGPVELPEYLNRSQIVSRADPGTRVGLAEFDRWAEPLAGGIKRVVMEDLAILLPTTRIYGFPPGAEVSANYQVALRVERLDAGPGSAALEAWWTIIDAKGATVVPPTRFHSVASVVDKSYDTFVNAESQALAQLSQEVAKKLHELGLPAPHGPRQ